MYILVSFFFISLLVSQSKYDGKYYDIGITMKKPSKNAVPETKQLLLMLGNWEIRETVYNDKSAYQIDAYSSITMMNRGHGYMEKVKQVNFDQKGNNNHQIFIYSYNPGSKKWLNGLIDEHTELAEIFDGAFTENKLIVKNAERINGGANLTLKRRIFDFKTDKHFTIRTELSLDYGKNWKRSSFREYRKNNIFPADMKVRTDNGNANPARAKESREFDFLIGKGAAQQKILLPSGQWVQFPSTTTVVYALNGKAVYEFNWYDVDTQNPDAASSIFRIYNRNMRRWESLYSSNRGNGMLIFGGKKEKDKIILHNFRTNSMLPFNRFIFHTISENNYDWYHEQSTDRGNSFQKRWIIKVKLD